MELGAWYRNKIVFGGKGQNPVFTDCHDALYREIMAGSIINTQQTHQTLLVDLDHVNLLVSVEQVFFLY